MNHIETIIKEGDELLKFLNNKNDMETRLADELRKKWPGVESVQLGTYKIYIYTDKHVAETYSRRYAPEVKMTCDGKMPETVEEFIQAKKIITKDHSDALNALYYVFFNLEQCYAS